MSYGSGPLLSLKSMAQLTVDGPTSHAHQDGHPGDDALFVTRVPRLRDRMKRTIRTRRRAKRRTNANQQSQINIDAASLDTRRPDQDRQGCAPLPGAVSRWPSSSPATRHAVAWPSTATTRSSSYSGNRAGPDSASAIAARAPRGARRGGHWMAPAGSRQQQTRPGPSATHRWRCACKGHPSFELFQFKSIRPFMTAKPARG